MATKPTVKQIEKMAYEIRQFLLDKSMWIDVTIYFNGKALSTDDRHGNFGYNDPNKLFLIEGVDVRRYVEYAGNILSMSFEGDFYDVVNYGAWPEALDEFNALINKYGLYYEIGNAWNLSLYPIPG